MRFAILEGDKLVKLDFLYYDDARHYFDSRLEEYVKDNNVTNFLQDKSYLNFKGSLDDSLKICESLPMRENCSKCPPVDHQEKGFCRCEWRNILLAQQRRKVNNGVK